MNECDSQPCKNGGSCNEMVNLFTCSCRFGFTGVTCSVELNECKSDPCVHGVCKDSENAWECVCDKGWTGEKCQIDVLECSSEPCENSGICTDYVNFYRVVLKKSFFWLKTVFGSKKSFEGRIDNFLWVTKSQFFFSFLANRDIFAKPPCKLAIAFPVTKDFTVKMKSTSAAQTLVKS